MQHVGMILLCHGFQSDNSNNFTLENQVKKISEKRQWHSLGEA